MSSRLRSVAACLLGSSLLLASPWAHGHASIPGVNHFYSGALHPLLAAAHAMALLSLGLLIGQRGGKAMDWTLPAFALGLAGGLFFVGEVSEVTTDQLLLIGALAAGLAVASAWRLPVSALAAAAGAVGLSLGLGSGPEPGSSSAYTLTLLGTAVSAPILLLYPALMVKAFDKPWCRIGTRVIGSWIAASALLVLALAWGR